MPGTPAVRHGARKVVLVVDDDPVVLECLRDILPASIPDVEALTAASGPEALRVLASRRVDLILTDYRMPGMDGLELLRAARTQTPDTSRVLITAFPELDAAVRAINEAGVEAFLTKPFAPSSVIDVVRGILEEPRKGRPAPALAGGPPAGALPARTPALGSAAP